MRRTAFTLPQTLQREYTKYVVSLKGYGPKGKSRWTREAMHMLFQDDPGLQHVGVGVDLIRKDAIELVYLDAGAEELLNKGTRILRAQYPKWEGVQGDIIRAAVFYRLKQDKAQGLPGKQRKIS